MVDDAHRARVTHAQAARAWAEVGRTRAQLDKQRLLIARGWSLVAEARGRHCSGETIERGGAEAATGLSSGVPQGDVFGQRRVATRHGEDTPARYSAHEGDA